MNILDRLKANFSSMTNRKAGNTTPAGMQTQFGTLSTWTTPGEVRQWGYVEGATLGFAGNELVYAIITDIAESAAEPYMDVYKNNEIVPNHPALKLFAQPNPYMSGFEMSELIMVQLYLAGNAFIQKIRSRSGQVVELWPIWNPAGMEAMINTATGLVDFWNYYPEGPAGTGKPVRIENADIIQHKMPNPLNPYFGLAPIAVATKAVTRDNQATDYVNAFFANSAVPLGLLKIKKTLQGEEADNIRALWKSRYSGRTGWYDVAVLDSETDYQRLSLTQQEMGMPELTNLTEERICMIFKWPPILIGALVGLKFATYSNFEQARRLAWEDTLSPIYTRLTDKYNQALAPDFGLLPASRPFRWNFSNVLALQSNQTEVANQARADYQAGGITLNEYRAKIGQPPATTGGDLYSYQQPAGTTPAAL